MGLTGNHVANAGDHVGDHNLIDTQLSALPGQIHNRNRPRGLFPSLQAFTRIGTILQNDATWKNQYAGIGHDVVFDPDTQRWVMIYCGMQSGGSTTFGMAYSDDGVTWADYGSNPVFAAAGSGQSDSGSVTYPQLARYNGLWYLFYVGFPSPGYEVGTPKLCYATAPSLKPPQNWTRHGAVVTPSSFPAGSGVTVVYRPTVIQVGSSWYLFTNAGSTPGVEDIWYFTATSPDGPWTVGAKVVNGTSFNTGASGTLASDPEIIRFGDWFVLLCWAQDGVHYAYCDISEFPGAWHPTDAVLPINGAGGAQRPLWVEGPAGPLLFLNAQGSTCIDLYVPSTSPLGRNAARERLMTTGRYYRPGFVSALTTGSAGDGYVTMSEFRVDTAITVTSLSVNVTAAAAAGVGRFGIYADDGTGKPGALVADAGTVSITSTGIRSVTGLTIRLKPGRYWLAFVPQGGSPTVTTISTGPAQAATSAAVADLFTTWFGWYGSGYSGALPSTASGIAVAANPIPLVVVGT